MSPEPHILVGRRGRVAILELGSNIVEHVHPQAHGLIKIDGPDRTIVVAGRAQMLRDDTVVLLRPWVPHAGVAADAQPGTRVLTVYTDSPRSHGSTIPSLDWRDGCHAISTALREATDRLVRRLMHDQARPDEADELLQLLATSYAVAGQRGGRPARGIDYRIRRAIERIRMDPLLAQDVAACARIAGLSRPHFFHLFRQGTGVTPRVFGNSLRLEAAIERLSGSSAPIHTVAEALGFKAPSHFTRFFLHHLGSTPRAYRHGVHGEPQAAAKGQSC